MSQSQASQSRVITPGTLVDEKIVLYFLCLSLTYVVIAMLAGLLYSLQFLHMYPFQDIELFSPGRWRFVHTQGVAYGFIANAFLGALHWAIPRLTGHPVASRKLSWFILIAWQVIVLATVVGVLTGEAQALEWGETPVWIDPVAMLGLLLVAYNFLTPIVKVKGPMYVSLWYFIAAFVWTPMVYAMGNFLPEYFIGGSAAGAIGGLFIHDLVGLFVTPIGWGLMYYFVPIALKKPIWSHGLSLVGFWGLAFFYPLNGIHHFLYSPIPMFLTVRRNHFDHRRRIGRDDGHHQLLRHTPRSGRRPSHQHARALVLHRHGVLLHHVLAVCVPYHAHVPAHYSLYRLGRRPRTLGHVRRVRLLAQRRDDVFVPARAAHQRLV